MYLTSIRTIVLSIWALFFSTQIVSVMADCDGCTVTCAITPLPKQWTPVGLQKSCDDTISLAVKPIGNPYILWDFGHPTGRTNAARTEYRFSGTAKLLGNTPSKPSFNRTFGPVNVILTCPPTC